MTIEIRPQGPIHSMRRWSSNVCIDYGIHKCTWEARVDFTVRLDFKAVLALMRGRYVTNNPRKLSRVSLTRAADSGRLYLAQAVDLSLSTATVTKSGAGKPCASYHEVLLDLWELPAAGDLFEGNDQMTRSIALSTEKCERRIACELRTDWIAKPVSVVFIARDNGYSIDLGDDKRGTVATHTEWTLVPPGAPPDLTVTGADETRSPESEFGTAPEQWKTNKKVAWLPYEEVDGYELHPKVLHCAWSPRTPALSMAPDKHGNVVVIPATEDGTSKALKVPALGRIEASAGTRVVDSVKNLVMRLPMESRVDTQRAENLDVIVPEALSPAESVASLASFWMSGHQRRMRGGLRDE